MTDKLTGEAQYSPTMRNEQTIHGTVQKIISEGNKKTYVIVLKPSDPTAKPVKKASRSRFKNLKSPEKLDVLKKNLSNITDDNYDSHKSSADLFLDDDDCGFWQDDGESELEPGMEPGMKLRTQLKSMPLSLEELIEDSGIQTTPPQNPSAVRSMIPSSSLPEFSSTPDQLRATSLIRHLNEDSNLSPIPVSFSTPDDGTQNKSPDSGFLSYSSSILSQNMLTPDQNEPNEIFITNLVAGPKPSSTVTDENADEGDDKLNTSLANIQWLGDYNLEEEKEELKVKEKQHVINRMSMEDKCRRKPFEREEIDKICRECGRFQRPPYSYMVLIQLALSSAEDHKMTLKEICKWIEDKFEFFKSVAKPGWRNSIRHNLSFYHCFVRDLSNNKKHGSKWMLRFDPDDVPREAYHERVPVVSNATSCYSGTRTPALVPFMPVNIVPQQNLMFPHLATTATANMVPVNPATTIMGSGGLCNKKRKSSVPLPILPRPASLQAYALVPLQSVQQQQHNGNKLPTITTTARPFIVHVPSNSLPPNVAVPVQANPSILTMQSQIQPKPVNVAPLKTLSEPISLVEQAWIDAECAISQDENVNPGLVTLPFQERPVNSNIDYQNGQIAQANKKQKVKTGLPIPTIYDNVQRKTKRTKSRLKTASNPKVSERNLLDSSDSECEGEQDRNNNDDLPTPIRQLFSDTPNKQNTTLSTSTPVRKTDVSSDHLPSPIRGFTPARLGNMFDGSFLDMIQEEVFASLANSPIVSSSGAVNNQGSPNVSLSEFGIFRTPPSNKKSGQPGMEGESPQDSHGQSLCRFLADFPIDSNIINEVGGFPPELSLNWNSHQTGDESKL